MTVAKEIWRLAFHHKGILKRRFPDYEYVLHEQSSVVILRISGALRISGDRLILAAGFSPSFLKIITAGFGSKTIYYANPEFTDDTIADELERFNMVINFETTTSNEDTLDAHC